MIATRQGIEDFILDAVSRALRRPIGASERNEAIANLGIDSLAMIGLMGELEDEYRIEIDSDQLTPTMTISTIAGLIEARIG